MVSAAYRQGAQGACVNPVVLYLEGQGPERAWHELHRKRSIVQDFSPRPDMKPIQHFRSIDKGEPCMNQHVRRIFGLGMVVLAGAAGAAQPVQPLGFAVGKATLAQVKAGLAQRGIPAGESTNAWSNGPMLEAQGSFGIDGVKSANFIFQPDGRLVAIDLDIAKSRDLQNQRFDDLVKMLSHKYTLDSKVRPFVGDARARFHNGPVVIYLDSPHMSFDMDLIYATEAFMKSFRAKQALQEQNKKAQAGSQL